MTVGEKLHMLRGLEGQCRGLGREMTQAEVVRAVKAELGAAISQPYLSLIENGTRPHLTQSTRQLLATFFKVHPGFLVDDPPGYHTELTSPAATRENAFDRWLLDGAARFAHDSSVAGALERIAAHDDSRRCLVLLGEILAMPGLLDQLSDTLLSKERS
jgi:transcriptional regulator with XRE-family HTH domain